LNADTDMKEKIGAVYDVDNLPVYCAAKQLSKVMQPHPDFSSADISI